MKNINPQLASQLRSSSVTSDDGLVCLGQQLEKDRENQLQYEQRKDLLKKISQPCNSETAAASPHRENPVQPTQPSHNQPPHVYSTPQKEEQKDTLPWDPLLIHVTWDHPPL